MHSNFTTIFVGSLKCSTSVPSSFLLNRVLVQISGHIKHLSEHSRGGKCFLAQPLPPLLYFQLNASRRVFCEDELTGRFFVGLG